jgi:hypothetical protein
MTDALYYVIPVVLFLGYFPVRRRFRGGLLDHPVDFLRRRLTRGLQVSIGAQEVRRGDEVEALVTISSSRGLGNLEVGVVCTESYDYMSTSRDQEGNLSTSRETAEAIAHEAWKPLEGRSGVQNFPLTIPVEAPFSYKGDCLSFNWEVVARGRKRRRLDTRVAQEISVLP